MKKKKYCNRKIEKDRKFLLPGIEKITKNSNRKVRGKPKIMKVMWRENLTKSKSSVQTYSNKGA